MKTINIETAIKVFFLTLIALSVLGLIYGIATGQADTNYLN